MDRTLNVLCGLNPQFMVGQRVRILRCNKRWPCRDGGHREPDVDTYSNQEEAWCMQRWRGSTFTVTKVYVSKAGRLNYLKGKVGGTVLYACPGEVEVVTDT